MHASEGFFFFLGNIFSLSSSCSMCRGQVYTSVLMIPSRESKSLLGQPFSLQDPGPCDLTYHLLSFLQALQLHLTSGTVMNIACSPARLSWRASSTGLGDSIGSLLHSQNKLSLEKTLFASISAATWEGFPPQTHFLVWMRLEMMGAGGSGYRDICFLAVIGITLLNSGGRRAGFFCFYTEDWKLWFNPWTV